jgi:GH25 family lysozyme M1 (1,4-beta-N-acetylmuramidase)
MTIAGIDVSQAQGTISDQDWQAVANSGVRFVYLRAGVGNDAPDTNFAANLAGARAAGLLVGAYNFVYPLPTDPAHPGRDRRRRRSSISAPAAGSEMSQATCPR